MIAFFHGKNIIAVIVETRLATFRCHLLVAVDHALSRIGVSDTIKINRFFVSPSGEWFDLPDLHGVYAKGLVEKYYPDAGRVDYMGFLLAHGWKKSMESSTNQTYLFCHDMKSPKEDFSLTKPQYLALKKFFGDKIVWKRSFVDPTNTEELTIDQIWYEFNNKE